MGFLYYYHRNNSLLELQKLAEHDLITLNTIIKESVTEAIHTIDVATHPHGHVGETGTADGNHIPLQPSVAENGNTITIPAAQSLEDVTLKESEKQEEKYHVVFSTDCSFFQDWQTLLIFHTAGNVKQPGAITRIASGCDDSRKKELVSLYQKLYPQYGVHFTPDFKTDGKTKKKYDFYNKPYGVHHWLLHAQPKVESGTIVIIIDPDMIFLRPITSQIRGNPANIYVHRFNPQQDVVPERVQAGTPVAQLYGLGAPWAQNHHQHFNRKEICGPGSPCLNTTQRFGEMHYSVGPPYLLEKDDLLRLVTSWTDMVPRVYAQYPNLLAEMYAYSMAAAHENLPHFTLENLMVSNTHANEEGWRWVDALGENVCAPPDKSTGLFFPDETMPSVLHFCQFYRAGELGFQKRRIRKELFACDKPMMQIPAPDLAKVRYKNRDGDILPITSLQARRHAFMLCTIHRAFNSMVTHYKSVLCDARTQFVNLNKTINVVSRDYYKY